MRRLAQDLEASSANIFTDLAKRPDTGGMVVVRACAVALFGLLLSSSADTRPGFTSEADLAAAIGCQSPGVPTQGDGYTEGDCTVSGRPMTILYFTHRVGNYFVALRGPSRAHLHGVDWDLWCATTSDCVRVQHQIGGSLVQDQLIGFQSHRGSNAS